MNGQKLGFALASVVHGCKKEVTKVHTRLDQTERAIVGVNQTLTTDLGQTRQEVKRLQAELNISIKKRRRRN